MILIRRSEKELMFSRKMKNLVGRKSGIEKDKKTEPKYKVSFTLSFFHIIYLLIYFMDISMFVSFFP